MTAGRPRLERPKKPIRIYLDERYLLIAKKRHIPIREIMIDAFEKSIFAYLDGEDVDTEYQKIVDKDVTQIQEMIAHIKAAIAAGKAKGEAEFDFHHVFPEGLWEKYGGLDTDTIMKMRGYIWIRDEQRWENG